MSSPPLPERVLKWSSDMKICVIDTETTGLSFEIGHRIIEVAALCVNLDTYKAVSKFEQRINPERSIDPKASLIHGITSSDLRGKPAFEKVEPDLTEFISNCNLLIAHNLKFDAGFLLGEYALIDKEFPNIDVYDTLECRWATPMGKPPSLKELCFACDIEYDESRAHSALYDVVVLTKCVIAAHKFGAITF